MGFATAGPTPVLDRLAGLVRRSEHRRQPGGPLAEPRISPATAEQVAERFGTPNVDVLKMQIRFALENRLTEQKRTDARDQLMPQVLQMVPIEIPDHVGKARRGRRIGASVIGTDSWKLVMVAVK